MVASVSGSVSLFIAQRDSKPVGRCLPLLASKRCATLTIVLLPYCPNSGNCPRYFNEIVTATNRLLDRSVLRDARAVDLATATHLQRSSAAIDVAVSLALDPTLGSLTNRVPGCAVALVQEGRSCTRMRH